jgi:hypothetical protein
MLCLAGFRSICASSWIACGPSRVFAGGRRRSAAGRRRWCQASSRSFGLPAAAAMVCSICSRLRHGGLEDQQLGQQSAACRCGLFGRRNRDGHTTNGGSSRQQQGPGRTELPSNLVEPMKGAHAGREAYSPGRSRWRLGFGGVTPCSGEEIPQCGPGMGLAMAVSPGPTLA